MNGDEYQQGLDKYANDSVPEGHQTRPGWRELL